MDKNSESVLQQGETSAEVNPPQNTVTPPPPQNEVAAKGNPQVQKEKTAPGQPVTETGAPPVLRSVVPQAPAPALLQPPPPGYYYPFAPPIMPKPAQPFSATRADAVFAVVCFALGYLFMNLVFFHMEGWGVTLFTVIYMAAVVLYAVVKKTLIPKSSWFWAAILLLTGLGFYLLPNTQYLAAWRILLLFGAAAYWPAALFKGQIEGKTGNFLPMDMINLLFIVPYRNFINIYTGMKGFRSENKEQQGKGDRTMRRVLGIGLGILLCIPLLAILLPLLISADSGLFYNFTREISEVLNRIMQELLRGTWLNPFTFFLAVPVSMFLCGLLSGLAHKRYVGNIDAKKMQKSLLSMRIAPMSTIATVLGGVSVLYVVFIACQIPYFFSAFSGDAPEGYMLVSEYAREGFFELCRIAGINVFIMLLAGSFGREGFKKNKVLRILNIILSSLTLLLLATAFSKMLLYMQMHGLTQKRGMTCVFMTFLAGIYVAVIVMQFRQFSIVRFAAVFGSALLCALCICNLDNIVMQYNASRFLDGTLPGFDFVIVERSGPGGLPGAMRIYEEGDLTEEQRESLEGEMKRAQGPALWTEDSIRDSVVNRRARQFEFLDEVDE